ncbi:MAG: Lrp/AsnC family transcriptional regulator [Acidimicrobiales bacterium]|nr:Lrp/AsnC family transcriptional regulator [Acidimicrobiales bacterium]
MLIDLDATDRNLLRLLQADARMTNAALAEEVHLSPSACLRRVRRLEESGVVTGYVAVLDRTMIGRGTSVFVEITLSSQQEDLLDEFETAVRDVPEVLSCHLMAGNSDYLVHVAADDVADYERIHRTYLALLPHVAQLRSSFALRTVCDRKAHELG